MNASGKNVRSIDDYIRAAPKEVQKKLADIRKTIRSAAPKSEEKISYQMPAASQNGILVYFAAFKNHIGIFPTASGVQAFKKELVNYECTKGTIHLPLDKPLPLALIRRIVKYRVKENTEKARKKTLK